VSSREIPEILLKLIFVMLNCIHRMTSKGEGMPRKRGECYKIVECDKLLNGHKIVATHK